MPVYTYDLEGLGKDDTDIRVIAMQGAVGGAMSMLSKADDMLKERVEAKRVEEEKARLAFTFEDHKKAVEAARLMGAAPSAEVVEKAPDAA
jgi:hypothetical protein